VRFTRVGSCSEADIETSTLQKHLTRGQQLDTGERRLYVLDESSLVSTKQMHEFLMGRFPASFLGETTMADMENFIPMRIRKFAAIESGANASKRVHTASRRSRVRANWQWK
jgi:hypothetical protein